MPAPVSVRAGLLTFPPLPLCASSVQLFEYVLDHLRAGRYGDTSEGGTLPRDARMLSLLKREAAFYCLPRLVEQVQAALEGADGGAASSSGLSVVASETQRQELDAVFVETGFLSREEVPEAQAEILQRLNAVVREAVGCGREHAGAGLHRLVPLVCSVPFPAVRRQERGGLLGGQARLRGGARGRHEEHVVPRPAPEEPADVAGAAWPWGLWPFAK